MISHNTSVTDDNGWTDDNHTISSTVT